MDSEPTPQGWYPAPDNPTMVRFWDGEVWTDRSRPAPASAVGTGAMGGPDHFVQHSPLVKAELRTNEELKRGYRSLNMNTLRTSYVVATDQRVFVVKCKWARRSMKSVDSLEYSEIETVGMAAGTGVVTGAGGQTLSLPVHGGGATDMVTWIRTQIDADDGDVDLGALPKPRTRTGGESTDAAVQSSSSPSGPRLGVADEIRKLDALRDEGLLTDAEFDEQKRRLLA